MSREQSLGRLAQQFDRLRELEPKFALRSEELSGWSVGEQAEHICLTSHSIASAIAGEPEPGLPSITPVGRLILALGWIPRGKGKSPAPMRPADGSGPSREELDQAQASLLEAATPENLAGTGPTARHPYFGGLVPKQWLRFASVHTGHHLKIIEEVLAAQR